MADISLYDPNLDRQLRAVERDILNQKHEVAKKTVVIDEHEASIERIRKDIKTNEAQIAEYEAKKADIEAQIQAAKDAAAAPPGEAEHSPA